MSHRILQLQEKPNGTFVEAGAYDGEDLSNSLYFEKSLGWRGVLIEPNIFNQRQIRLKQRKAYFVPGCLAGAKPIRLRFECPGGGNDKETWGCEVKSDVGINETFDPTRDAWCFPLYSVLRAVNLTRIDYLVLDLEGFELNVIEAFPFDKIDVKVIQIEANGERKEIIRKYFRTNWPLFREIVIVAIDVVFENTNLPI